MKKGLYFLKDKKAKVYKIDNRPHGVGEDDTLVLVGDLWCYSKQLSQNLIAEAGIVYVNNETRMFVFNYNSDIEQGCFIKYRDEWFHVNRVDTTDDYNGEMFVYVNEYNGRITEPTSSSGGSGSGSGGGVGVGEPL